MATPNDDPDDLPAPADPTGPADASADDAAEGYRYGSGPYRRITIALFLAGLATFALLYDTQPLLPTLAAHFGVSAGQSAWTVSFATVGLGLALLVAGPASEVVGRTPLIFASLFASGVVGILCGLVDSWPLLLALRALQGITLAGLPAVAMAYVADEVHRDDTPRAAGLYVGGTALGGMAGRLITGVLADLFGWHAALLGVGIVGLACAAGVFALLPRSRRFTPAPAGLGQVWRATRTLSTDPAMLCLFGIAFAAMGAFVGVYNVLGFRLERAPYGLSVGVAGLVFLTYALGSVSSTYAGRAAARWGHRAVEPLFVLLMLVGVVLTLATPLWLVVVATGVMTVGFFAAHGVASGWVASRASLSAGGAGQASSFYLFFYYLGSSLCGSFAGQAWSAAAWPGVVALAGGLVVLALGCTLALRRIPSLQEPPRADPGVAY